MVNNFEFIMAISIAHSQLFYGSAWDESDR